MPNYMLDTDTVSFALRGYGRVGSRLLEHRPSELCMSSITLAELRFGAETRRSRKLHNLINTVKESIAVVHFDNIAADYFGTVAVSLARRGVPIGTFDTLIAAHALSLGIDIRDQQRKTFRAGSRAQDRELGVMSTRRSRRRNGRPIPFSALTGFST